MLQHHAYGSSNLSLRYVYDNVVNFSPSFVFNWSSSNGPSHDLHEHVIPVGNDSYSLCSYLKAVNFWLTLELTKHFAVLVLV